MLTSLPIPITPKAPYLVESSTTDLTVMRTLPSMPTLTTRNHLNLKSFSRNTDILYQPNLLFADNKLFRD